MIILTHSETTGGTLPAQLGRAEYSYYFVQKEFRPVLELLGMVVPVADPEHEADRVWRAAAARGEACVFLSFAPPHRTATGLACPTVPVFAWEFDTLPDEVWDDEPRHDWVGVLRGLGRAVVHSEATVGVVRAALGETFPVRSIPAPVWDRFAPMADPERPPGAAPVRLQVRGTVLDSRELDLAPTPRDGGPGGPDRSVQAWKALVERLRARHPRGRAVTLDGIVYSSAFNPEDGRKNWPDMVASFCRCFADEPGATLLLKLTHYDGTLAMALLLGLLHRLAPFRCRVVLIHGFLEDADYAALAAATSYVVNTAHGEGQCLPLMEFMSAGKPAIAPCHTGMADYIAPDCAFVVESSAEPWFWPQDSRRAFRTHRRRIDAASLDRAYRQSFALARDDRAAYRRMSEAATAALRRHCAAEVAEARLREVITPLADGAGAVIVRRDTMPDTGLLDVQMDGWFNSDSGELFPGFPIRETDVVADIGCGDGGVARFCAARGAHLVLADIDPGKVAAAAALAGATRARRIEPVVSDSDPLPIPDAYADVVICTEVIEHVPDPARFMAELARIGRPGARYLLTVPHPFMEDIQKGLAPEVYWQPPQHVRVLQPAAFARLAEEAGLVIERKHDFGFYWGLWWTFFWSCGVDFDRPDHPALDHWRLCWHAVLTSRDGRRIQQKLNAAAPKSQMLICRKP